MAVNPSPSKSNHLYVAYADKGTNAGDKANTFLVASTNGGVGWTAPVAVNTVWTNDQWMPVLAVKPDGTKLFLGWYDRRNDTNNSLIDVYGRWASIGSSGAITFDTEFRITTTNFPPVFAGTLTSNTNNGHYDPVYPPEAVSLKWWYSEWPPPPELAEYFTLPTYISHVGEYNGAWAEGPYVYLSWTDYRMLSMGTLYGRNQSDVRMLKLTWP